MIPFPCKIHVFNLQPAPRGCWLAFGTYTGPDGRQSAFRRWTQWVPTRSETETWLATQWRLTMGGRT